MMPAFSRQNRWPSTARRGLVGRGGGQAEFVAQFLFPLVHERGHGQHQEPLDHAPGQQFLEHQPGLDRLAQTDLVGEQRPAPQGTEDPQGGAFLVIQMLDAAMGQAQQVVGLVGNPPQGGPLAQGVVPEVGQGEGRFLELQSGQFDAQRHRRQGRMRGRLDLGGRGAMGLGLGFCLRRPAFLGRVLPGGGAFRPGARGSGGGATPPPPAFPPGAGTRLRIPLHLRAQQRLHHVRDVGPQTGGERRETGAQCPGHFLDAVRQPIRRAIRRGPKGSNSTGTRGRGAPLRFERKSGESGRVAGKRASQRSSAARIIRRSWVVRHPARSARPNRGSKSVRCSRCIPLGRSPPDADPAIRSTRDGHGPRSFEG